MYDFYKNTPQTIEDVKEYLNSWLEKVILDENIGFIEFPTGTKWYQTHGFRRAFSLHQVYCDEDKRFAFNVDENGWDGSVVPNMGIYDSWEEMIDGVSMKYAIAWKLTYTSA